MDDHLRKSDFSRWIADIFGDYPLEKEVARLEKEYRTGMVPDIGARLGQAVRARYEFIEPVPPSRS
ncbi:MAG: hypothetical protein EHM84_03930 [Lysobacterales bacterium]|nr:MAG: hypothetical protein EHM84_03930 [Xanthomonadales bacterium]